MTSASELFYIRRSRAGRLSDPDPSPNADPDPHELRSAWPDPGNRRRPRRRRREAAGDERMHIGPPPPRRRGSYGEYVLSHLGNSTAGASTSGSNRLDRLRFHRSDRLPGAVLQAQARVIERLRGISLGSSFSRPAISVDEFAVSDVFRIMDFGNRETTQETYASSPPLASLTSESDEESPSLGTSSYKRSPGLGKEAFLRLQAENFHASEDDSDGKTSMECSICLDGFYDGDVLVRLRCGHRFHTACLEPWVQKCGDCPYCRSNIRS